jgi:hypothetical protein
MMGITPEENANELRRLYESELCTPFPYSDASKLRREGGELYEGFIPDLDMHFSDIAGYCSWGGKILRWPKEKIDEARERLSRSFFERFPKYDSLQVVINELDTPALYKELQLHERMRRKLLDLLEELANNIRPHRKTGHEE